MQETSSKILTVTALNQLIRFHLEESFPKVLIEGEISNLRIPSSGHIYLTLKDASSQIRAVIFRSASRRLKFVPQDGMKVICRGQVSVYELRGEYQLIVTGMEPRGVGALQLALEQLKEKLKKEGLFDTARKRSLPLIPKRIGVITSPTGAAIRDILKVFRRPFANVSVLLNPVLVQGETAAESIAEAIRELNNLGGMDVLIVGRGGGSLEDLWAFNEEVVARAIHASKIPVISAVGHEIDYTISDLVADVRAATPTSAAEMLIQSKSTLITRVHSWRDRLETAILARNEMFRAVLQHQTVALKDPRRVILAYFLRLDELDSRINQGAENTLRFHRKRRSHLDELLQVQNPVERLKRYNTDLQHSIVQLRQRIEGVFKKEHSRMEGVLGRLHSLSPLAVLERGYGLTYLLPQRRLVKEARQAKRGDRLEIQLRRGRLECKVEDVKE